MRSIHLALPFTALLAGTAHADGELDCDIREPEYRDPSWSGCVNASAVSGCIGPGYFGDPSNDRDHRPTCLELDAPATLCPGVSYDITVYLTTSDVSLDCQGATIDHHYVDGASGRRSAFQTRYEDSVSDIEIRNCTIQNIGRYGFNLKRFFRDDTATGGDNQLLGPMIGHERITIENTFIQNTRQHGIYVGQNSRDFTFDAVVIDDAFTGIYLEAGSSGTRVDDSWISNSYDRGGIHIDASYDNLIEDTVFTGNSDGGILMYKNCGEVRGQVCPIRRQFGADNNVIRNNEFWHDQLSVAYRQFKLYSRSEDPVHSSQCEGIDLLGYWRDHSSNNVIYGNTFSDGARLDIQDEPNVVYGNVFYDSALEIGTGTPTFDDAIYYSGAIAENVFDDSVLASQGNRSRAFIDVDVSGNVDGNGECVVEAPLRVPYSPCPYQQIGSDCYGLPEPIDGASCAPRPVMGPGSWDLIVPVDAWGGGETDMLVYDRDQGTGTIYRMATDGEMTRLFGWDGWRTSWHTIVPGDFDGDGAEDDLLFYDRTDGAAQIYRIEQTGEMTWIGNYALGTNWDRIVPFDFPTTRHTDLVLHERNTGWGQIIEVDDEAKLTILRSFTGWQKTWDLIVPGDFDGDRRKDDLLFYDRTRGVLNVYDVPANATLVRVAHHEGWSTNVSQIAPIELDASRTDLVVYDNVAGRGQIYRTSGFGALTLIRTDENWRTTWRRLVAGDVEVDRPGANEILFHDGFVWQLYSFSATGAMSLLTQGVPPDAGEAPPVGGQL